MASRFEGEDGRPLLFLIAHHSSLPPDASIEPGWVSVDQRVTVRSEAGALPGVRVRSIDIRPGNAVMYYPEANVLVPMRADPGSRTPAFKNTLVTVEPTPQGEIADREPEAALAGANPRRGLKAC